jgi:hypothetical protein
MKADVTAVESSRSPYYLFHQSHPTELKSTRFTMKHSPPIEDGPVTSCNCTSYHHPCLDIGHMERDTHSPHHLADALPPPKGSICHANGYLMVYPLETNITWISGKDDMTSYVFGKERIAHSFCPTCGTVSSIYLSPPLPTCVLWSRISMFRTLF